MFRVLAPVSVGVLVTLVTFGSSSATPLSSTSPESTVTGDTVNPDAAAFERQLAELSFGTFLALELDVSPSVFTCTEPRPTESEDTLTCFAIVGDQRVIIATAPSSGETGRFMFDVLADYELVAPATTDPAADPAETVEDSSPVTYSSGERNDANVAVLLYADEIDEPASGEMGAIVEAANETILSISTWRWDAARATFLIDYTLVGTSGMEPDASAWLTTNAMSVHWDVGQPFRAPAATIRPTLSVTVDGIGYLSSWDVMTQVADGTISDADWVAVARQS